MNRKTISYLTIVSIFFLTLFFGYALKDIRFDYDVEKFFPEDDANTAFYQQFRKEFENDNDYVLIGIKNEAGIFYKPFLKEVDKLYRELSQLESVEFIQSPTNTKEYKRNRFSSTLLKLPYLHINDESRYPKDSSKIFQAPLLKNFLFSDKSPSVSLFIKHENQLDEAGCEFLVDTIKTIVKKYTFDELHIAGKCFGQIHFKRMIEREVGLFITASVLLVIAFLYFFFRRFWGIWMPLMVVGLAVLWTMSILTLSGSAIFITTNTIPTFLLVIGISDVIHLLVNYLSRDYLKNKWAALKASMKEVGLATIMTTVTTGIGFMSLTTSSYTHLEELGIFATVGLILALIFTYTLLPAFIYLHPPLQISKSDPFHFLNKTLDYSYNLITKYPNRVLIGSFLFFILGVIGTLQIKTNNYILEDLKPNHPEVLHFNFFADNFSGVRPFELLIEVKDSSKTVFDKAVLDEINQVENYLKEEYAVNNILSPSFLIKYGNQIYRNGKSNHFKIPEDSAALNQISRKLLSYAPDVHLDKLFTKDLKKARISGKVPDLGSYIINQKNDNLFQFLDQIEDNSLLKYQLTGSAQLVDINNSLMVKNVLYGLLGAIIIIAIICAFFFKSWVMVGITIVVNLLPLILLSGIMGFTGIDLKISTSIIFIIAFGIAVDDSIHFLSRFRKEIKVHEIEQAIKNTFLGTGKAILLTSLILAGGFLTLCLSDFLSTFYIGLLVTLMLIFALVADLTLLPVLLKRFYKQNL